MQNAQNAQNAEIQQRVINLVELYRTKVGKESQIAKEAKADKDYWDRESVNMLVEEGITAGGIYGEGLHNEIWTKHLMVNEQLLGHFYAKIANENAEKEVLDQLLPELYDASIFSDEEENFLVAHFREMVNYIVQTPCNDLAYVNRYDNKDIVLIPDEILSLIKSRVNIPSGSTIYNPFTGFAQIPLLYPNCTFYCEDSYVSYGKRWNAYCEKHRKESNEDLDKCDVNLMTEWMKIALYANSIDSWVVENGLVPGKYDHVVSFIPEIPDAIPEQTGESGIEKTYDPEIVNKLFTSYENLPNGGAFVIILQKNHLWASNSHYPLRSLWEKLIKDKSLKEVVQLPSVMYGNYQNDDYCLVIAEKGLIDCTTTMIDARFATKKSDQKNNEEIFDLNSFKEMIVNNGRECATGLRKMISVPTEKLNVEILIPQIYVVEKPLDMENPIPLSMFGTLATTRIRSLKINLPEDTPWVELNDLSYFFKGELDVASLKKAECPNNPVFVEGSKDYAFNKSGNFIDNYWAQVHSNKGCRVCDYRRCTFLDGSKDAVLFRSTQSGMGTAIVRCEKKPIAIGAGITVFVPKDGVDALNFVALLRQPVVCRQIQTYKEFGLENYLDDILVPTDKRIIGDELYRMKREESVSNELGDKVQTMKTEYINEVRMRKHDMRPHLRQLASSQRLMLHYIDLASDIEELKRNLRNQLEHIHVALTSLSSIVDHLSDEEKFGTPELLNIDSLLSDIEVNHDESEGFAIEYDCDKESFKKQGFVIPDLSEQWQLAKDHGLDMAKFVQAKSKENLPLFVNIAPVDFQRMVDNIIENARKHGFTDRTRTDYYMGIDLSINTERNMYQIDFLNNGTPLPDGMTKTRYGLKGEKAGQTGGTGSGGYIVKSIISHYGGDYDVFCKDGVTTIRIYLPIATI